MVVINSSISRTIVVNQCCSKKLFVIQTAAELTIKPNYNELQSF